MGLWVIYIIGNELNCDIIIIRERNTRYFQTCLPLSVNYFSFYWLCLKVEVLRTVVEIMWHPTAASKTLRIGKLTIEKNEPLGRNGNPVIVDYKGQFEKIPVAVRRIQKSQCDVSISHHKEFDRHENIARYYVTEEDEDY